MENLTGFVGALRLTIGLTAASLAFAQTTLPDFSDLSLDQLANVKITSFTNKEQQLSHVAGAVYVITQEQIARSGLSSVPELLRLAPGIDVAQVNGNQWSISARGTVGVFANKLLVLIDGRSIYSPVFSGVYWEIGMPMLENIERIEVIRGPGATIWGANAVLGVVNIITKSSKDTHGTTITASAGSSQRTIDSVTMGGAIGSTNYRAYVGGSNNAAFSKPSGASANDGWDSIQAGFRLDGSYKKSTWMLEGDMFRVGENEVGVSPSVVTQSIVETPARFDSTAGNISGEWRRRFGETAELHVSSYYNYVNRPEPQLPRAATSTWDTELQYDFTAGHRHNLSVGSGARVISEAIETNQSISFSPAKLTYANMSAFAQDEIHFLNDTLLITLGAKLEHNHFGGWGPEPSANVLWMPRKEQSIWISAARSLRTPTLFELGIHDPLSLYPASPATGGLPVLVQINGSPSFSTEVVNDFEAGYRVQISKSFSADVTAFYDQFTNIRSYALGNAAFAFFPAPHLDVSEYEGNDAEAVGKGAEVSLAWKILPAWKLEGSYSYNIVNDWLSSSAAAGSISASGKAPSHNKWRIQSYVNLSKSWKLDTFLYWTSQASPTNTYGPEVLVPSYTRLDIRIGYKPGDHWQLSLAGQNLLQARHLEGLTEVLTDYSYVNRGIALKSTWQF